MNMIIFGGLFYLNSWHMTVLIRYFLFFTNCKRNVEVHCIHMIYNL